MADENMAASLGEMARTDDDTPNGDTADGAGATTDETPVAAAEDQGADTGETDDTGAGTDADAPASGNVTVTPNLNDALASPDEAPAPRKDVPGGRSYEIIYIVRPGDPEAQERVSTRVRELIDTSGGAVDNLRSSEVRRLAYPIKKQLEGIYVVVNARFVKDATAELDRFFKLEEAVLRHMVIKEDT